MLLRRLTPSTFSMYATGGFRGNLCLIRVGFRRCYCVAVVNQSFGLLMTVARDNDAANIPTFNPDIH